MNFTVPDSTVGHEQDEPIQIVNDTESNETGHQQKDQWKASDTDQSRRSLVKSSSQIDQQQKAISASNVVHNQCHM